MHSTLRIQSLHQEESIKFDNINHLSKLSHECLQRQEGKLQYLMCTLRINTSNRQVIKLLIAFIGKWIFQFSLGLSCCKLFDHYTSEFVLMLVLLESDSSAFVLQ